MEKHTLLSVVITVMGGTFVLLGLLVLVRQWVERRTSATAEPTIDELDWVTARWVLPALFPLVGLVIVWLGLSSSEGQLSSTLGRTLPTLVGGCLSLGGLSLVIDGINIRRATVSAPGTVIQSQYELSRRLLIEFIDGRGVTRQVEVPSNPHTNNLWEGSKVRIYYDPLKPNVARIGTIGEVVVPIVVLVGGVGTLIVGMLQ